MSLKRKIQYVYTISSAVIAVALVLGILLSTKGMNMLTDTLDNNDKALELYRAVTKEGNALKLYFAAIFIVLLLVTYIPAISLWLPGLLGYVK